MKCPKCNFENKEEALFCMECGEALALKCPGCGSVLSVVANFCDRCGISRKSFQELKDESEKQLKLTSMNLKEARSMFEKIYLEKMLENFEWNISRAAEAIGIERSNLHRKIKRYGIKAPPIKK